MKYFIILVLLFLHLTAQQNKQELTIGAGPYFQSQPYKEASALVLPSPVIFFDNSVVYARWSRFGLYFLGDKKEEYSWGFSFTVQPRTLGYKASDSVSLQGMSDKDSTMEGGIAFSAGYKDSAYIEVMLLADILNKYNSWIGSVEIGDKYTAGRFTFYPSAVLLYQPRKFLDYYYGVKNSEATLQRPAYMPKGGFSFAVQTYIKYPLTKKLSALLNIRADRIPNSAYNSPLVNNKFIYSGLASVIYTFIY
ncbi:MipA/OmpV family protein [Sulfurimonas sp. SWIR-19]|uniref:MipA/OmpV family protein n=1 Tax=Sulfurimonas sp. SWIR-19 TaxID=2878390 RepID=UPI001CF236A1|nr:MipA/OmpV family protein [Sulfurimonas sp. SWIR-19]UCM99471.1 MipA/OmpV family protein [Sulfurimonas sp. SWIR-19]